ncbi:MAG TPA: hypothetical protein PK357_01760 [Candidatus Pacearchaeota archaeon]|nr:hypothetical protein [Candidatus Pacearchaeota archaeon]
MNKWLELIVGLILLVGAIALVFPGMPLASWGRDAIVFLKGGLTWMVIFAGLVLIILGISELKE